MGKLTPSEHDHPGIIHEGSDFQNSTWSFLMGPTVVFCCFMKPMNYIPYGSKYLLRKCLEHNLLQFGGLSTFSDSVWIHRDMCIYIYIYAINIHKPYLSILKLVINQVNAIRIPTGPMAHGIPWQHDTKGTQRAVCLSLKRRINLR